MDQAKNKIGLIGLAVMGENFAKNFASKGISISVYNRTESVTKAVAESSKGLPLFAYYNLKEFVESLEIPRKIIILVKAGSAVDLVIESLIPLLSKEDIIIDSGNSFYQDTLKRFESLEKLGLNFVGMGISGGEKGALLGPSIMPGGKRSVVEKLLPLLETVSAKAPTPCVTYVGNQGAGHYVKMVHNGIEYADMELIAESYSILNHLDKKLDLGSYFNKLNSGILSSYLIEITGKIFEHKDDTYGGLLVDKILDRAKGKGTGVWTSKESLDLEIPVPAISAAVSLRQLSSLTEDRKTLSDAFVIPKRVGTLTKEDVTGALIAGKILAYASGIAMLQEANRRYDFHLELDRILEIWRGGCIIRSTMLDNMASALRASPHQNLILSPYFKTLIETHIPALREVVIYATQNGIPVPALSSSLWYFDTLIAKKLPANLIQAQRDFFGAHTYERTDKPGTFHTEWEG